MSWYRSDARILTNQGDRGRFSVSFSSYSRTSVRNLNRRAVPCRGPRLFRLTRSIRFPLRETAHWAGAHLVSRALRLLGQVRNSRGASILQPCSFAHHASASLHPALRALGSCLARFACSVRFAIVAGPQFFGPAPLLTTLPPRFIPHCGRSAPRPIDVNDVLCQPAPNVQLKFTVRNRQNP